MSGEPLYLRVAEKMLGLAVDGKLPTQDELADRLGVSRGTVGRAASYLKGVGRIHTRHDGTYLGPRPEGGWREARGGGG